MANLRELNTQSNPFWEWVADIERQSRNTSQNEGESSSRQAASVHDEKAPESNNEKHDEDHEWREIISHPPPPFDGPPPVFADPPSPPPPDRDHFGGPQHRGPPHRRGPGGERGRGHHGHGGGGRHHGPPGPPGHGSGWGGFQGPFGGPFGHRRGGCGGRRGGGPFGMFGPGGFDMDKLGQLLRDNLGFEITNGNTRQNQDDKDFSPAIDVFDTPQAYYIHISLAGAKKQDISVSWDAENYQVVVSGIIHRPGDEDFLKTIAVEERGIGLFERKIKLGTRAAPVSVDGDSIFAKMEDGVLMIKAPKHEEFVEIKKVDIQ